MKIFRPALFLVIAALATSCGHKETKPTTSPEQMAAQKGDSIQRMQSSHSTGTASWHGAKFSYDIKRSPNDSLPTVTDENGTRFADNSIDLVVTKNGSAFFSKTFSKRTFDAFLDKDFREKGILEGIVFDKAAPDGLHFAASVSFPQSDMYIPLVICIGSNGHMSITKDTVLDSPSEDADSV
jgi:hypothetical protein